MFQRRCAQLSVWVVAPHRMAARADDQRNPRALSLTALSSAEEPAMMASAPNRSLHGGDIVPSEVRMLPLQRGGISQKRQSQLRQLPVVLSFAAGTVVDRGRIRTGRLFQLYIVPQRGQVGRASMRFVRTEVASSADSIVSTDLALELAKS